MVLLFALKQNKHSFGHEKTISWGIWQTFQFLDSRQSQTIDGLFGGLHSWNGGFKLLVGGVLDRLGFVSELVS